jgi:hypothetical protein
MNMIKFIVEKEMMMIGRLFICFCVMLTISCARKSGGVTPTAVEPTSQFTGSIVWQNYAGNEKANYVAGFNLPKIQSVVDEKPMTGTATTSPVLFKESNNKLFMLVLVKSNDSLSLKKYSVGDTMVEESDFSVPPLEASKKDHQMALIESNGEVFVFVANANGIHKYNAHVGGEPVAMSPSKEPVSRLLVHNDSIYAQTASALVKFDSDLNQISKIETNGWGKSGRNLPLVISGDRLYAPTNDGIIHASLDNFEKIGSTDTGNDNIGAVAAAGDNGLIYTTIAIKDWSAEITDRTKDQVILSYRKTYIKDAESFGNYAFTFAYAFSTTEFHAINADQFKTKIETHNSKCYPKAQKAIGDADYTGLVVTDDKITIPMATTSLFSHPSCAGSYVTLGGNGDDEYGPNSPVVTTLFGEHKESGYALNGKNYNGPIETGTYFDHLKNDNGYGDIAWHAVPRFMVSDGTTTIAIQNSSQNLHSIVGNKTLYDISNNELGYLKLVKSKKSWSDYFLNMVQGGSKEKLTAYNTHIMVSNSTSPIDITNPDAQVVSMAVSETALILVQRHSSTDTLVLIK